MRVVRAHKSASDMRTSADSSLKLASDLFLRNGQSFVEAERVVGGPDSSSDSNSNSKDVRERPDGRQSKETRRRTESGELFGGADDDDKCNRWNSCKFEPVSRQFSTEEDDVDATARRSGKRRAASRSVGDFLLQTSDYLSASSESELASEREEEEEGGKKTRGARRQLEARRRRRKAPSCKWRRLVGAKSGAEPLGLAQKGRRSSVSLSSVLGRQQHLAQQSASTLAGPGEQPKCASGRLLAGAHNSPCAQQVRRRPANDGDVVLVMQPEAAAEAEAAPAQGQDRHRDNARSASPRRPAQTYGSSHNNSAADDTNDNGLAAVVVVGRAAGSSQGGRAVRPVGDKRPAERQGQQAELGQLAAPAAAANPGAPFNSALTHEASKTDSLLCCLRHESQCEKCQRARGGHQQRAQRQATLDLGGKLMEAAAHYCSSWNLLNLHHSSTYKVAQHQQHQQHQQQQQRRRQERLACEQTTTTTATTTLGSAASGNEAEGKEQEISAARASRGPGARRNADFATASGASGSQRKATLYSRPGRSPISLQRQTNARLAKHRQRIQHQRQQQLAAHLAQQQRPQQQQQQQHQVYSFPNGPHQPPSGGEPRACASFMSEQNSSASQRSQPSVGAAGYSGSRQHTSIEICDNPLLALQTGQLSRGRPAGFTAGGATGSNVVVYKTINMMEANQIRSEAAYEPFFAAGCSGGASSSRRSSGRYVRAERVDQLTFDAAAHDDEDSDDQEVKTICSSEATSSSLSLNRPFCKICHLGNAKNGDKLISPCRCAGTMQYIHCGCLLKWLEISNKTNEKPMSCELCAHEYTWHKRFNYKQMRLPKCSYKDIILHSLFVVAILAMLGSALAPVLFKKVHSEGATRGFPAAADRQHGGGASTNLDDNRSRRISHYSTFASPSGQNTVAHSAGRLASDEKFMLFCAASFFVSFFFAVYTQTKTRDTLYGLIVKFLSMNQTYYITEYDHEQHNSHQQQANAKQQQLCNNDEESRPNRKSSAAKS